VSATASARTGTAASGRPGATFVLTRKRVYILPTRQGAAFATALAVMLAGAMNYNNALGYVLTFLLASLALVSLLHTYRNLAGLAVSARPAPPVFAGGSARFPVRVDNPGGPARHGVVLSESRGPGDVVVPLALGADSHAEAELPVRAPRRGWRTLERVCIASRAPFGIFRAWYRVPLGVRTLIYPHPEGAQSLPDGAAESREEHGHGGSGRDDFAGLREYRRGDSPRHVHWKAAARAEVPPVKQFEGARTADVVLRLADARGPHLEARLSQLAAWVLEAEAAGLHYGLDLGEGRLASAAGPAHQDECLRRLALFRLPGGAAG